MAIRPRILFVLLALTLLAAFAALNWSALSTPASLDLLIRRVEAPLGLAMLGILAALTVAYLLLIMSIETTALLEARRSARQLESQRRLAEEVEASRLVQLQRHIEGELADLRALLAGVAQPVIARLDHLEHALIAESQRNGNTLAAYIGELEDRLIRGSQPPPTG